MPEAGGQTAPGGMGGIGGMGGGAAFDVSEECAIVINGGYVVVDATGDGVDSNGSIEMTGGVLLVSGPTNDGNGAFDYGTTATISGGTAIVAGSSGMAQGFSGGTQAFSFVSASGQANSSIAVTDPTGAVIASFTPSKSYQTVVISTAGMAEGGSYSLVIGGTVSGANADGYASSSTVSGGTSTTFTASTTATATAGGMGAAGGMGPGARRGMTGASA